MRLKGKLSRVYFAAVSQAKKENTVKEELGWEHLSVIVWKQVLARQNQQYQEGEGSKGHGRRIKIEE